MVASLKCVAMQEKTDWVHSVGSEDKLLWGAFLSGARGIEEDAVSAAPVPERFYLQQGIYAPLQAQWK